MNLLNFLKAQGLKYQKFNCFVHNFLQTRLSNLWELIAGKVGPVQVSIAFPNSNFR